MEYKILVADDDKEIREAIEIYLTNEQMKVLTACDGQEALKVLEANPDIHLIIMDLMMPKMDGIQAILQIRKEKEIPIIVLSAKSEDKDVVLGLNIGADDYITKPFNILELKARIKAILRRSVRVVTHEEPKSNVIKSRDLEIDLESRRCFINGKEKNLTAKEFDLLELFMKNPGKVYSRDNLLTTIWGAGYPGDVRAVDVHVRRLREKIEAVPSEPEYIHTKWGVGYYFQ